MKKVKLIIGLLLVFAISANSQNSVSIPGLGDITYVKNENVFVLDILDYGQFEFTGTIQPLSLSTEASIDQLSAFPGYHIMSVMGLDSIFLEASTEGLAILSKIDTGKEMKALFDALKIKAPTIDVETKIGKGTFELEGELSFPEAIELVYIENPGTRLSYSSIGISSSAEPGSFEVDITTGLMIKPSNVDPDLETYFTFGYNLITQELKGAGSYMTEWIDPFGINTYVKDRSIILNGGALEIGYIPGSPTPTKLGIVINEANLFGNEFSTYVSIAPADKQIGLYATRVDRMSANDMSKILREGFGLKVPDFFPDCYSLTNSVIQFSPTELEVGEYSMPKGFELSGYAEVCDLITGDFTYYFDMEDKFTLYADFDVDAKKFLMNEARKVDFLAAAVEEIFKDVEFTEFYVDMSGSLQDMTMAGKTRVTVRLMDQEYSFEFEPILDPEALAATIFHKLKKELPGVFNTAEAIGKEIALVAGPAVNASIDIAQKGFDELGDFAGHATTWTSHMTHGDDCFHVCVPNRARDLTPPVFHSSNLAVLEFYSRVISTTMLLEGTTPYHTTLLRSNALKDEWNRLILDLEGKWDAIFYDDYYKGFDKDPDDVTRYGNEYRRHVHDQYLQHVNLRKELWRRLMTNGYERNHIKNRWKPDLYMHHEHDAVAAGNIQPGWFSAHWEIEPVFGSEYVFIKNAHSNKYLHVENGTIESGDIASGWHSAHWKVEGVQGTEFVRLRNRWKGTLLNVETGALACSDVGDGAYSAMWELLPLYDHTRAWNTGGNVEWTPGQTVVQSADAVYSFVFQEDGNLVLYRYGNEVIMDTQTYNKGAQKLVFQTDGNLVIYGENNSVLWASNSHGKGGEALYIENGEVVLHAPGANVVWSTAINRAFNFGGTKKWYPNETVLRSENGRYRLIFQIDGNLGVYEGGNGLWFSGSHFRGAMELAFQDDGNLCIRTSPHHIEWATHSYHKGGDTLYLQDDGNLVIHAPGAVVLWARF